MKSPKLPTLMTNPWEFSYQDLLRIAVWSGHQIIKVIALHLTLSKTCSSSSSPGPSFGISARLIGKEDILFKFPPSQGFRATGILFLQSRFSWFVICSSKLHPTCNRFLHLPSVRAWSQGGPQSLFPLSALCLSPKGERSLKLQIGEISEQPLPRECFIIFPNHPRSSLRQAILGISKCLQAFSQSQ